MSLLKNLSVISDSPGREIGGFSIVANSLKVSRSFNFYFGDHNVPGQTIKACFPSGSQNPSSLILAPKGGELSSTTNVYGQTVTVFAMAMGKACSASLAGSGAITPPSLSLIVQLACSLLGSCGLSASLTGKVEMASALAGSGDITSSLNLIANIVASLGGTGALTGDLRGTASLSADILPYTTLSPENLARAVWEALAATYNNPGTMGEKLNSAGGGSSPADIADAVWDEMASTHSVTGSMAVLLKKIKALTSANL